MAGRTVPGTLTTATLSISASIPPTYDSAGYKTSSIVWTEIGQVENFGAHGPTSQVVTFTPVKTGTIAKMKGSRDNGNMSLMLASIPTDSGQSLLRTAAGSTSHYSVKLVYPDLETHYLDVLVSKFEFQDGSANDVMKVAVEFAVSRDIVYDAAP